MKWFLAVAAFLLFGCASPLAEVDRTEFVFGSYLRVKALGPDRAAVSAVVEMVFDEMRRLDSLWSSFSDRSEVSHLNRTGSGPASEETRALVAAALEFGAATDGAFDITVRPVLDAWGVTEKEMAEGRSERAIPDTRFQKPDTRVANGEWRTANGEGEMSGGLESRLVPLNHGTPGPSSGSWRVPDSVELAQARARVDYRRVEVRGDSVVFVPGTRVDLGGLAVGFAVDRAVEMLKQAGVRQALVDAGGDIRVFGDRVWRIGLKDPRGEGVVRSFEVKNRAVSTSGDYQKFFEVEGRRFHHIVNPKTGYPASECASVTVFAATSLEADAFSTAVFALGPDAGLEVVRRREGMGAVVLVQNDDSLVTKEAGRL